MIKFSKEPRLSDDYEKNYIIKNLKPFLEQSKMYDARLALRDIFGNEYLDIVCFLVYHLQDNYFKDDSDIFPYEFAGAQEMTAIVIPNWITTICEGAFVNCENLRYVTIPTSVSSIEKHAFRNTALKRIVIPKGCDVADIAFDDSVEIIRQ